MSAFLSTFEEELHRNNEVLCITMSSRLSGTFGTAHIAAKQTESDKIAVFDSQFTGGGLYLIIKEAKKLIDSGISLNEIMNRLPEIREKITVVFSVDDMAPLRDSGRIGFVRMSVSTFLNIKPILLCKDGAVVSDCVAQGNTEIIKKMIGKISANTKEIVVNYIGDNRLATNIYHVIKETFANIPVSLQSIGPVLGIHLGLKAIAASFTDE
jgi:DegV family protein with EDD domain